MGSFEGIIICLKTRRYASISTVTHHELFSELRSFLLFSFPLLTENYLSFAGIEPGIVQMTFNTLNHSAVRVTGTVGFGPIGAEIVEVRQARF